ncbi:Cullin-3 [Trichinella spiralis]|uniref:Cullin-3 n=1 Tax=Trichinella spiralis TaxID=6334 RepID=A0ABR3KFB7_TRISP
MVEVGVALLPLYIHKGHYRLVGLLTSQTASVGTVKAVSKRGRLWIDRTRAVWTTMQSLTSLFHSLMLDAGVRRRFDE